MIWASDGAAGERSGARRVPGRRCDRERPCVRRGAGSRPAGEALLGRPRRSSRTRHGLRHVLAEQVQ